MRGSYRSKKRLDLRKIFLAVSAIPKGVRDRGYHLKRLDEPCLVLLGDRP